jgi:hypothetical protein
MIITKNERNLVQLSGKTMHVRHQWPFKQEQNRLTASWPSLTLQFWIEHPHVKASVLCYVLYKESTQYIIDLDSALPLVSEDRDSQGYPSEY